MEQGATPDGMPQIDAARLIEHVSRSARAAAPVDREPWPIVGGSPLGHLLPRILERISLGVPKTVAAASLGVSRSTLNNWERLHPEVSEAIERAQSEAETMFLMHITYAAAEGVWQAAAWWLERRRPESYGKAFTGSGAELPVGLTVKLALGGDGGSAEQVD